MWKRLLVAIIVLALLGGAYVLIRPFYRLPFDRVSVIRAVPSNTGALVRLPSLVPQASDSISVPLWNLDAKRVASTLEDLGLLQTVDWESWWLIPQQGEGPTVAAYTFVGVANSGLAGAWSPKTYGPSTASSAGAVFIHQDDTGENLYYGRYHNLLIAGKYSFQIEAALSAAKGDIPAWENEKSFQTLLKDFTALEEPTDHLQLIINTEHVSSSLPNTWFDPNQLLFWQAYFQWLALDLKPSERGCKAVSYSRAKNDYLPNGAAAAWQWVPEIVDVALPLAVAKKEEGNSNTLAQWVDEAVWRLTLARPHDKREGGEIWVLPVKDTSAYERFREAFLSEEMITDQRSYQLYELTQLQSGKGFEVLTDRQHWQPWTVDLPDALVVGVFREDLERWLDYHLVNGNILEQDFFLDLKTGLPNNTNTDYQGFLRWGPIADAETHLMQLLFPGADWAREGGATFVSSRTDHGNLRTEVEIGTVPERSLPATIRWTLPLTGNEDLQLYPVQELDANDNQHYLVQSASGTIWLFDVHGTILWEKQNLPKLYAPVWAWKTEGGAHRWGATSPQGLHVWDEDGQNVQLPVISSVPAAGLSLFSFDSKGTPSLAYPNRNAELELRNTRGISLEGWPAKLSGSASASFPLVHWQTEFEDLIVAWTETEGWQFFGRKGGFMYSLPAVPEPFLGQPGYDFDPLRPSLSFLLGATNTGKVNVWDLEGNIVPIPLGRGPLDRWLFQNCWGDSRQDHVAQRGNLVHLFGFENDNFGERWQQRFSSPPDTLLAAESFGTLVLNNDEQKVWLIDTDGQIPTAFPLAGKGGAHLVRTSTTNCVLITLLDGQVYAYDLSLDNS